MPAYNIQSLPENLEPGEYDVNLLNARLVICRDGSTEIVFDTEFRGPRDPAGLSLVHFTKD